MLGVLGQATLNFIAVATLLFFCFCECPKFYDLAKQRRKKFLGVSEVRKIDFALYFFWLCVFFLVFYFLLLRSRDTGSGQGQWELLNQINNTNSYISARARRILIYRIALWLRAAPCWA